MEMEQEQHTQAKEQQEPRSKKPSWLARILDGGLLQRKAVTRQIPVILLGCFYALVLVYNRYKVEDLTKAKLQAQDRINYLRESRIELQKRYQETVKISQIAALLDSTGVGITAGPPYEI